ncbi:MAG: hypothetical protein NVSMB46_02200 [Candidatus Saccharimonadales bacterium]
MKPRIVFIHGNGSDHWSNPWTLWLKSQLEQLGYPTFFETMPDSILARSQYWLPFINNHIKAGPKDVIVGWSSGAVATMRYAEQHKILGSVLISPCYTDLDDESEKQSGYYDDPWQWQKIKAHQLSIALIWGNNDPYIPQREFHYISSKLQPTEIMVPNGKHFIEKTTFPEVLNYLLATYP